MPIRPPVIPDYEPEEPTGLMGRLVRTIDDFRLRYGERLKDFLGSTLAWGLDVVLDVAEKAAAPILRPIMGKAKATGKVPPELDGLLGEIENPESAIGAAFAASAGGAASGGLISSTLGPYLLLLQYEIQRMAQQGRLDPGMAVSAELRDPALSGLVESDLRDLGWTDDRIGAFRLAVKTLTDAGTLTRYKFRFNMEDSEYYTRMAKLGFDEAEAKLFLDAQRYYPSPMELVMWQAREVFEPGMVERYGLDDELEGLQKDAFYRAGMDDEQIRNHWRAHWQHASWVQVIEMLRRGQLTEGEVREWFRVVEIPPFWRDKLIAISWAVPTRVDVRRFWDMRTIDEDRLKEIYGWQGYHGKDLDDYVLWTKVYVAFPDLLARWKNGWITLDQVRSELIGYGMTPDRMEELIETKVKTMGAGRTTAERDLTKTDIYKGVKKGILVWAQGVELLVDLGYDPGEADYILRLNVPVGETTPELKQRELTKGDIKAAFLADVISADEAYGRLMEIRYNPDDAAFIMSIYETVKAGKQEEPGKSLTKADITKAVKLGLIEPGEGFIMLQDIGYDPAESEFILAIVAEAEGRSPISFGEFKDLTQRYRQSQGLEAKMPSEIVTEAEQSVVRVKARIAELERRGVSDDDVAPVRGELAEAEYRLRQLLITEQGE